MTNITFIHAADLHLDSPFHGISGLPEQVYGRIKNSTFESAANLFRLAIGEQADFILLAGDLFDEANRSLKAQLFLRKQFLKLRENGIQVYVIFGNHDHMGGEWTPIEWPDNVHIFSSAGIEEKSFYKNGRLAASIYGYSYPQRSVFENKAADMKRTTDAPFHIGMIHGALSGEGVHDPYCPFSLQDLKNGQMDYWALGHIHKRQVISAEHPVAIYPGNTQSRHMKETGEKGCFLVKAGGGGLSFEFRPTSDVLWEAVQIDVSETQHVTDLISRIETVLQTYRSGGTAVCVKAILAGEAPPYLAERPGGIIDELLDIFREEEKDGESFIWLAAVEDRTESTLSAIESDAFFQELTREIDDVQNVEQILADLERHAVFRRYGKKFNEEDFREIRDQAKKVLLHELRTMKR
ncbi:DNA repair exonuclease [Bacillus sonorensis]|uniref:Metallophosphoesterase YhaO n=2 Tax=Bacillus sonorensis TaxID=119858 RepID=M5P948_9BACI|nr:MULTISPECIES: DNA repair exonuclease [Bacillus]TWK72687.1 putative metallophosphoesterase YhaO [Bacillus paralicheniformis]ASB90269.1 putative metallophosphoesterase YhaO [Bacillus sonorensis]EME75959.1 metallophosphoesterase YhaO [Bacillus sonorensis L12]MBG9916545.1 metallophosphoesterase [Bacillus sonorensis]MCF7619512.1 DNA repair exonuclease [Bacillus sonorensis]